MGYEGKQVLVEMLVKMIIHTYKCANRKLCMHTVDDIVEGIRNYFKCIDLKGEE